MIKMIIRSTVMLLSTVLVFLFISFGWFIEEKILNTDISGSSSAAYYEGGNGEETSPFIISEARHLYNFAWLQNLGTYNDSDRTTKGDNPYYFILKNDIDLNDLGNVILPPIGTYDNPFCGVFDGNGYSIKNLTISTDIDVLTSVPKLSTGFTFSNYVGFFGETNSESVIKNFVLNNPFVEGAKNGLYNNIEEDYSIGLAVGHVEGIAEGIGVYKGRLSAPQSFNTYNSIIGSLGDDVLSDVTGSDAGNDTGVMYADDIYSNLKSQTTTNSQGDMITFSGNKNFEIASTKNYFNLKKNSWLGSSNEFGIFNLTGSNSSVVAFGEYFTSTTAKFYQYDYLTNYDSEKPYYSQSGKEELSYDIETANASDLTFGDTTNSNALKFVNSTGEIITSIKSSLYFENGVSNATYTTVTDNESGSSAIKYNSGLFFEITNQNGGEINFIASLPRDKNNGSNRKIGLWMLDSQSTTTSDGSLNKNTPNIFNFNLGNVNNKNKNLVVAISFKLPKGSYILGSSGGGLYFNYVSVAGATGGSVGSEKQYISNIDFIYDNVCISQNEINMYQFVIINNQIEALYKETNVLITWDTANSSDSIVLYFERKTENEFIIYYLNLLPKKIGKGEALFILDNTLV